MTVNVDSRQKQLENLQSYLKDVDTEVTIILQNLQWNRKHLTEHKPMVACQYDTSHRIPPDKLVEHENDCFLKSQGYVERDRLLPSPFDPQATILVKLGAGNIEEIIRNASQCQPLFKTVPIGSLGCDRYPLIKSGCTGPQPLTLERLQATYTADERRALHDAVVHQVPSCHDLSDLALLSSSDAGIETKAKSKMEILAELRDMRRRRTKYRVASKTKNYSNVLRDVIATQMELYTQAHTSETPIHKKKSDLAINSNANNDLPKDKNTDMRYSSNGGQSSTFIKDMKNTLRYPNEENEIKTRRHNDRDYAYYSTSCSQTQNHDESTPRKMDHYKGLKHYESKFRKRDYEDKDSTKAHRKRHRYDDHYEGRERYREKEYDRKRKTQIEEHTSSTAKDKSKDHYYTSKTKEKYQSYEQNASNRVSKNYDYHRSKKSSPRRKDNGEREKKYKNKQKHEGSHRIKKEKHGYYDENSSSNEDSKTEYSDISSRSCETHRKVNKVKVEKKVYVKNEALDISRHSNATTYKDKSKYYQNIGDRTNNSGIREQERRETENRKFKEERN